MTAWETLALLPAVLIFSLITIIFLYGLMVLFEAPRIITAVRRNWREEKKLHFWGTTLDLLVSPDS